MPPFLWFLNPHLYQAHLREVCGGCWPLEWVQESVTAVSLPGAMLFESTAVQAGLEFQIKIFAIRSFSGRSRWNSWRGARTAQAPKRHRRPRRQKAQAEEAQAPNAPRAAEACGMCEE